jgi:valyl-tRNA synthetase
MMPFVTEAIWEYLNQVAPQRGLESPTTASQFTMLAPWPKAQTAHHDDSIERQFAEFQQVVGAIRKIRASQNIPTREIVPVSIRCSDSSRQLLEPMSEYFRGLAQAEVTSLGPAANPFQTDAPLAIPSLDIEVHVDLVKFIDIDAELNRLEKLLSQLIKQITGKEQKLNNESFVSRAPDDVVQRERESLGDLQKQRQSVEGDIRRLKRKV